MTTFYVGNDFDCIVDVPDEIECYSEDTIQATLDSFDEWLGNAITEISNFPYNVYQVCEFVSTDDECCDLSIKMNDSKIATSAMFIKLMWRSGADTNTDEFGIHEKSVFDPYATGDKVYRMLMSLCDVLKSQYLGEDVSAYIEEIDS